jgi:hypothetical protein
MTIGIDHAMTTETTVETVGKTTAEERKGETIPSIATNW